MTAHPVRSGIIFAVLVAAAVVGTTASALAKLEKGPSQAVIDGPGISSPIALRLPGQPTIGPALATMVEQSGFSDGLFRPEVKTGAPPNPTFTKSQLGPRYTVTYTLPGPGGRCKCPGPSTIVQYLYPYAAPGPVTHMPPGQPFWRNGRTAGAWHLAGSSLKEMLIQVGLPKSPPGSSRERADASRAETQARLPVFFVVAMLSIALGTLTVIGWGAKRRDAVSKTAPVSPAP